MVVFRIKEIRENKNITQYALSKKTKISRSFISELENNKRTNATLNLLMRIADAIEVDIKDLFYSKIDIEDLKMELNRRIDKYGMHSRETMEISKIIDMLVTIKMREL